MAFEEKYPIRRFLSERPTLILREPLIKTLGLAPKEEIVVDLGGGVKVVFDPPEGALTIDTTTLSDEELVTLLTTLPWARKWAEGICAMAIPEWDTLPREEKERRIRHLIETKLVPAWKEKMYPPIPPTPVAPTRRRRRR